MMALRCGVEQRWQTKRGPPDDRHIIDWITFDTHVTFFPDDTRDNFGKPLGLLDYDFVWHAGDRLTFTSDACFDFFDEGQKVVDVGAFLTRPPRGSLYLGFRVLEGPVDSKTVTFSYSYWMSPKWISSFGTSYDFVQGNIGQNLQITRVGESFLISVGVNYDATRGTYGASVAIEPRFLPRTGWATSTGPRSRPPERSDWSKEPTAMSQTPNSHAGRWIRKFGNAFRGVRTGIRGQNSFVVHLPMGVLVVAAGVWLAWRAWNGPFWPSVSRPCSPPSFSTARWNRWPARLRTATTRTSAMRSTFPPRPCL